MGFVPEETDCPQCGGPGWLTLPRIRQLKEQGHKVDQLCVGHCIYCTGSGRAPTVVAELVAPDDFNNLCRREPFSSREECLEIIHRLEDTGYYNCLDDAWAATAELLAQSAFDPADLPALLWEKALPLLHGNSLGRMLAIQVRLSLFTPQQAVVLAFRKDHPRATGISPLNSLAPKYFAFFHKYWLRSVDAETLSEILPEIIQNFPDKNKQPMILGKFLVALAEVAPEAVARRSDTWLPIISSYHGDFIWDIWVGVVPRLTAEQAAPWIKVLNGNCKCPHCGGEGRVSQETINYLKSDGYAVGNWTPSGCFFCKEKGIVPVFIARLQSVDWTWGRILQQKPHVSMDHFLEDLKLLESEPDWENAWWSTAVRLTRLDSHRIELGKRLWEGARPHLDDFGMGVTLACLVSAGVFGWREAAEFAVSSDHPRADNRPLLNSSVVAERFFSSHDFWLTDGNIRQVCAEAPQWLERIPSPQNLSNSLSALAFAIANRAPETLIKCESTWFELLKKLPWNGGENEFPRTGATGAIARDTLALLPAQDALRWVDRLMEITTGAQIANHFFVDMELIRFAGRHLGPEEVFGFLQRCIGRAKAISNPQVFQYAMTWLSAGLRETWQADDRCFSLLSEMISHAQSEPLWGRSNVENSNEDNLTASLSWGYSRQPWSWDFFEELVGAINSLQDRVASGIGLRGAARGLQNRQTAWLDRALAMITSKVVELPDRDQRSVFFQEMHPVLASRPNLLLELETDWFRLLGDLPKEDGSNMAPSVREQAVIQVCRGGLVQMSTEDVEHWTNRLIAETDGLGNWHFSQADGEILKLIGNRFGSEKFESTLPLMLERICKLPDLSYAPFAIGCLAFSVSGYSGLGLETYRCLCEFLIDSGMDEAFSMVSTREERYSYYPSAASQLVRSISGNRDAVLSWEVFEYLVQVVGKAKLPVNRAESLGQLACGLIDSFPEWGSRAIQLLIDRTEQLGNGILRPKALEEISKAVASTWQKPEYSIFLARLFELSRSVSTEKDKLLMAWIPSLFGAIPDISQALPVRIYTFETILEKLGPETDGKVVTPLMNFLTKFSIQADFLRLFQKLLAWIDCLRKTEKCNAFGNVLNETGEIHNWGFIETCPKDKNYLFLVSQIVRRLLNTEILDFNCNPGFDNLREVFLKTSRGIKISLEILAYLGANPNSKWYGEYHYRASLAHLASALAESTDPFLPESLQPSEFDELMTGIQKLGMPQEIVEGLLFRKKTNPYKGIPRLTALQAMLRRFQQVGNEAWRDGLIVRALEHARSYEDPAHQKLLVGALLEGLGEGELTNWHKSALHKIANFTCENERSDLSILQAGIVRKLLGSGDIPSASRLAAGIPDIDWRNQSLADVARVVAPSAPSEAVGMLEEILSPEVRGKLAVDLSALPSMTGEIEQVWALLRAAADDPETIQGTLVNLLERADAADLRGLITSLGLSPAQSQKPAMSPNGSGTMDPVATILQSLEEAELITSKKRDRLSAWRDQHRSEIDRVIRKAVLDYMVAGNQVSPEDAEELERRPLG